MKLDRLDVVAHLKTRKQTINRLSETVDRLSNWSNSNGYKIVTCSSLNETVNWFSEMVDRFIKWSNPMAIKWEHIVHNS